MKTQNEVIATFNSQKDKIHPVTGYKMVPAGWTKEELRQAARDGFVKLLAGRHPMKTDARESGMGWRLIK